jgi:hypothetical protein
LVKNREQQTWRRPQRKWKRRQPWHQLLQPMELLWLLSQWKVATWVRESQKQMWVSRLGLACAEVTTQWKLGNNILSISRDLMMVALHLLLQISAVPYWMIETHFPNWLMI